MRAPRSDVTSIVLALLGLAAASSADAQTTVCSDKTGAVTKATCLTVASTSIDTSQKLEFVTWIESRPNLNSNNWSRVPGTISIRENSTTLISGGTRLDQGETYHDFLDYFGSPAVHVLYARSSTWPDSPTISVTVNKFTPRYAMATSATVSRVGQSVQIQTNMEVMKPNGTLVFYVKPPGGATTEYARKTLSVAAHVIDNDVRSFTFAAPYNVSGEYAFSAGYLGDALNAANSSGELVKVLVGPFATTTTLTQSSTQTQTSKPVTLTATISGARTGVPLPSGNVEFYDGAALLGSAALSGQGTAALTTGQLAATGTHSLTARYGGDFNYQASTSAPVSHDVAFDPALLVPILQFLMSDPPPP